MKTNKATRKAIPYQQIHKLAEEGLGAVEIAKKTNRLIKGDDPAHSIRAILSKMRTVGYKNKDGKVVKLKIKRVGFVPKPVKTSLPKLDNKTLAAGGGK